MNPTPSPADFGRRESLVNPPLFRVSINWPGSETKTLLAAFLCRIGLDFTLHSILRMSGRFLLHVQLHDGAGFVGEDHAGDDLAAGVEMARGSGAAERCF